MSSLITFHFKSKHLTSLTPVVYGSPPELGGGDPENGVEMVQIEDCIENGNQSYNFIAEILFSNQSTQTKEKSEEWYSYAFKPQFGQIFPETASYRHFPSSFYTDNREQSKNIQSSQSVNHIKLYDTEGLINAASDCLLVRFKVSKHVEFGTEIFISGNCEELGNWELSGSRPLSYASDGSTEYWFTDVKFPIINDYNEPETKENENEGDDNYDEQDKENKKRLLKSQFDQKLKNSLLTRRRLIEYKYFLSSSTDDVRWEPEDNHKILLSFDPSSSSPSYIEVCDTFRYTDNIINVFSRSAFVNVINKRGSSNNSPSSSKKKSISKLRKDSYFLNSYLELQLFRENVVKPGHVLLSFTVNCPYVQKRQHLIIVGGIPELGNWNPVKGLKMSDIHFPYWTTSIVVNRQNSRFSYKYVIEDMKYNNGNDENYDGNRFIWENCENRNCYGITNNGIDIDFPSTIAINDWYVSPHINKLFRGVTINVPLFSLKSNNSCGIGEYSDIKLAVDICRSIGSSMIQLMPINDTMRVPFSTLQKSPDDQIAGDSSNGIHLSSSFGHFQGLNRGIGPNKNPQIGRFQSSNSMSNFNENQNGDSDKSDPELEIWAGSNPYNIVSVFALNPVYINLQDVLNEEFEIASKSNTFDAKNGSNENFYTANNSFYKIHLEHQDKAVAIFSDIQNEIITNRCRFEQNGKIDYPSVLRFKMKTLRKIFDEIVQKRDYECHLTRDKDFIDFTNENEEWLKEYSVFCYLRDIEKTSDFTKWNIQLYEHTKSEIDDLYETCREEDKNDDILFTLWCQYICDRQMRSAKEYAVTYSIALKAEMPYNVPFNSSDCWAFRKMFDFESISGSPPDSRSIEGQNFNVPIMKNWTGNKSSQTSSGLVTSSQALLTVSSDPSSMPASQSSNLSSAASRAQFMKYGNHHPSMQKTMKDREKDDSNLKLKQEESDNDESKSKHKGHHVAAKWWEMRMKRMSSLFDAVEIDNILNFFRNWVIPNGSCRAVNGHFSPSKPYSQAELADLYGINTEGTTQDLNKQKGPINLDSKKQTSQVAIDRLVKPYVRNHILTTKFRTDAPRIASEFFVPLHIDERDDYYEFQERCNTEEKIINILKSTIFDEGKRDHYQSALFQLLSNVLLIKDTPIKHTNKDDENEDKSEIQIHDEEGHYQSATKPNSVIDSSKPKYHVRAELSVERLEVLDVGRNRTSSFAYGGTKAASIQNDIKNGAPSQYANQIFYNKKNNNVMGCTPRTKYSSQGTSLRPSTSWVEIPQDMQTKLLVLCKDYFFGQRNQEVWLNEARPKFNVLNESSSLLIFSNDFSEISAPFERELENHQIIKYNVPRYPRNHPTIFQIERENRQRQKLNPYVSRQTINSTNIQSHLAMYKNSSNNATSNSTPSQSSNDIFLTSNDIDYLSQCVPTPTTEDCLRSWWESTTMEFWKYEMVSNVNRKTGSQQNQLNSNQNQNQNQKQNSNENDKHQNNNNNNDQGYYSAPRKVHQVENYNYLEDDDYFYPTKEDRDRQPYISDDLASQPPPKSCEPWVQELIVSKYLASRSMWCTFLLQDLTSVIGKFRKQCPKDECVHRPEQGIKWEYRFPYKLEDILNDGEFTGKMRYLIDRYRGV